MEYFGWLVIVIFLIIIEVATTDLLTIWFIVSGIATLILSLYVDSLVIQLTVFVIGGVILLLTTRPIMKKYLKPRNVKVNIDRILDMTGIVTEDITDIKGAVKVDGKVWTAYSDKEIKKGEKVKILEIKSTKLKVEKE